MIELFQDQQELLDKARAKIGGGCKRLLIQAVTGSGKTIISSKIIYGAYMKGTTAHFIVPRKELLRQTSKTFDKFQIDHSYIASGMPEHHRKNIFVCSKDTLIRRLGEFNIPRLAIFDECHWGGHGLDDLITKYSNAGSLIIGLSATPKPPPKGKPRQYDDMVCGKSIRWLIDNKRLSEYKLFSPDIPDLSGIRKIAGEYNQKQLAERMENDKVLIGSSVEHYKKYALGKLGVTFAVSRKHSEILAQAYRDAGIVAMHMDGNTPEYERIKITKAYARREIFQLCCAELLTFGWDLSSASGMDVCVETMTDDQPTESLEKQLQKWGRVLRYKPFPALIFDHAGNAMKNPNTPKHGFPCWEREWDIEARDKKDGESYERNIEVVQCSKCFFCFSPKPACPNCGFVRPIQYREIKEVSGELRELEIQQQKKMDRQTQGRAKTLSDLQAIAKERGYKSGWVWKMAKIKGIKH